MTTSGQNIGRRPARQCKKKSLYEDVLVLSSDDETVDSKRLKRSYISDDSFRVNAEKPKKTVKSRKKITQSTEESKQPKAKTNKKRVKVKTEESNILTVDLDEHEIPTKKVKTEFASDSHTKDEPVFSKITKQELSEIPSLLDKPRDNSFRLAHSHVKPELDEPQYQATNNFIEISRDKNWECGNCFECNFHWRVECFRCHEPKPTHLGPTKSGDWVCKNYSCGAHNFPWRNICFRCKLQKPSDNAGQQNDEPFFKKEEQNSDMFPNKMVPVQQFASREGDWKCINCASNNFHWRKVCFRCQSEKPLEPENYVSNNQTNNLQCRESQENKFPFRSSNVKAENDWVCSNTKCSCINFAWREQCFRCQTKRPNYITDSAYSDAKCYPIKNYPSDQEKKIENQPPVVIKSEYLEIEKDINNSNVKREILEKAVKKEKKELESSIESLENLTEKTTKKKVPAKKKTVNKKEGIKAKTSKNEVISSKNDRPITEANHDKIKFQSSQSNDDQTTKECRLISKKSNVPYHIVVNLVNLFNSDATVPFIVRYRSHLTGGLSPEEVRMLKQRHESIKKLIDKADKMKIKLETLGYLDAPLANAIDSCVTQQELDYLYEPFKVLKSSKLVKVIDLGLSTPAENVLYGRGIVNLENYVKEDLSVNEITDLIIYYVGEMMSKDSELMDKVRELMKTERIYLNCKQKTATGKKASEKVLKKNRPEDVYSNYYNFACPYHLIKPHQTLAINRGETEHCLQVTLTVPDSFRYKISQFARKKWYWGAKYDRRELIFNKALDFMYTKRVCPYLKRHIRTELTKQGEKASLEVFSLNLKHLLLTQPVRNVTVCSVDPGFKNGCKIAILNPQQEVLEVSVLYLSNPEHFVNKECMFVRLINKFNVNLLVVGNGKGCREVELMISKLIEKGWLDRTLKYVVASENGISVYSCSTEAAEEYPSISPNIISAISLAKRVQDPLCELVKVDPKHLGVGMYQHDINEKKLETVLDDVVSECVSIVGVDVNNAPLRILKRVAGLSESKAKTVIDTRESKGPFLNREDLKKVKGIGPKTFQQCAGFIKIIPGTCIKDKNKVKSGINYFDQTIIHPEDYGSSRKILELNGLQPSQIGSTECIEKLKQFMACENLNSLATKLHIPLETVNLILGALTTPLDWDIRCTFDKPLFRNKVNSISDLFVNTEMSGRVENVTHFGAFVDLGVECSGLIHVTKLNGKDLHLGQIVKVKITEIDTTKMRIGLSLVGIV